MRLGPTGGTLRDLQQMGRGPISSTQPVGSPSPYSQPIPYQGPGIPYTPGYGGPPMSGTPGGPVGNSGYQPTPMPVEGTPPMSGIGMKQEQPPWGGGTIGQIAGGWLPYGWGQPPTQQGQQSGYTWGRQSPTGQGAPFQQTGGRSSYGR